MIKFLITFLIINTIMVDVIYSQSGRSFNREGVTHYKSEEYEKSEVSYRKALKKQSNLIESSYNLGLSYYKQQKYPEAINQFKLTLTKTEDRELIAKLNHNLGNTYLELNQFKESIEAYQNSLRINPGDNETRYNLTYALMKMKARNKTKPKDTQNLLDKIEQEENISQQFMRRNRNLGKEVKNW